MTDLANSVPNEAAKVSSSVCQAQPHSMEVEGLVPIITCRDMMYVHVGCTM